MVRQLRNSGLIVIGASLTILMMGLAAIMALPLIIAGFALSLALAGHVRKNLDRLREETFGGRVIEGE